MPNLMITHLTVSMDTARNLVVPDIILQSENEEAVQTGCTRMKTAGTLVMFVTVTALSTQNGAGSLPDSQTHEIL